MTGKLKLCRLLVVRKNESVCVRRKIIFGRIFGNGTSEMKKPPVGGFTTLLIALIILYFPMVPGAGLEPAQRERRGILNWL